MNAQLYSVLEQIEKRMGVSEQMGNHDNVMSYSGDSHYSGTTGVGNAVNIPNIVDRFSLFIQSMVDSICAQYGCDDEAALDCISQAADELADMGMLPPLPDRSDLKGLAAWQGKAVSVHLPGWAYKCAFDKMGGALAPDGRNRTSNSAQGHTVGEGVDLSEGRIRNAGTFIRTLEDVESKVFRLSNARATLSGPAKSEQRDTATAYLKKIKEMIDYLYTNIPRMK